jgi:hypothetical protein
MAQWHAVALSGRKRGEPLLEPRCASPRKAGAARSDHRLSSLPSCDIDSGVVERFRFELLVLARGEGCKHARACTGAGILQAESSAGGLVLRRLATSRWSPNSRKGGLAFREGQTGVAAGAVQRRPCDRTRRPRDQVLPRVWSCYDGLRGSRTTTAVSMERRAA